MRIPNAVIIAHNPESGKSLSVLIGTMNKSVRLERVGRGIGDRRGEELETGGGREKTGEVGIGDRRGLETE